MWLSITAEKLKRLKATYRTIIILFCSEDFNPLYETLCSKRNYAQRALQNQDFSPD